MIGGGEQSIVSDSSGNRLQAEGVDRSPANRLLERFQGDLIPKGRGAFRKNREDPAQIGLGQLVQIFPQRLAQPGAKRTVRPGAATPQKSLEARGIIRGVGPALTEGPGMNAQGLAVLAVNDNGVSPNSNRHLPIGVLRSAGVPVPAVETELAISVGPRPVQTLDQEGLGRKRAQMTAILGPELADRESLLVVGPLEVLFHPGKQFLVPDLDVLHLGDRNKEIPPDIADFVFDMALLVTRGGVTETDRESVVAFKPQE